jgi:uncharacterized glyoxalase superfamily protein PhnB
MTSLAKQTRATIVPALRYRDAQKAIQFLCHAFGFEKGLVVDGPNNTIAHAQLTFGNGMIMLGSHPHEGDYGRWVQPPTRPALVNTQGIYVVVTDPDEHCARAQAYGAEILMPLTNQDYGGRDYTARDPEGHVWTFGTYDPWAKA